MAIVTIIVLGVFGALVPSALFVLAKARPIDVGLAAAGYGGFVAVVAAMGPYYGEGPYLFVPLATLFTVAWVSATVRVVHYRGPVRWRWQRPESDPDQRLGPEQDRMPAQRVREVPPGQVPPTP
jgi:hypothetical protein